MAGNRNLNSAARAKKDEFYTQRGDIENELGHYWKHFTGKIVLCNCDDPFESQFFYYFAMKFNVLKLKKLIVTSYHGSPVQGNLFNPVQDNRKPAYKVEINHIDKEPFDWEDVTEMMNELKAALEKNSSATVDGNTLSLLNGDGDFRSPECVEALREADIVVTNPPFSLFREYVKKLVDNDKKFLIIGNINAVTYKEIFPLIMQDKIWLGVSIHSGDRKFNVPDNYQLNAATCGIDEDGKKFIRVKGVRWFTNLEHEQRNCKIDLTSSYSKHPEKYPRYDNYDAIEVSKTAEIPEDYFDVMGVPITFLDKYCPDQFEILGNSEMFAEPIVVNGKLGTGRFYINGKRMYDRILIRRREHGN